MSEIEVTPALRPTPLLYKELQDAYDFFNVELFDGELPPCVITLQRQKSTMGFFSAGQWTNRSNGEHVDELAMNPSFFAVQTIKECMQTMVHEQCHLWQQHFGKPGRGRYHNKEWADKMQSIGLIPSDTGHPGGKMTGDNMSDYVFDGGPFDLACAKLLTKNFALSWLDRFPVSIQVFADTLRQLPEEVQVAITPEEIAALGIEIQEGPNEAKPASTVRYKCPLCKQRAWGKRNLQIGCLLCKQQMEPN